MLFEKWVLLVELIILLGAYGIAFYLCGSAYIEVAKKLGNNKNYGLLELLKDRKYHSNLLIWKERIASGVEPDLAQYLSRYKIGIGYFMGVTILSVVVIGPTLIWYYRLHPLNQ